MSDATSNTQIGSFPARSGPARVGGGWRLSFGSGPTQAFLHGARNAAAAAFCLLGVARLLVPGLLPPPQVALLVAPLIAVIATGMSRGSVPPTLACAAAAGLFLLFAPGRTPVVEGLAFSTTLAAFLGAVVLLRQTLAAMGTLDAVTRNYAGVTATARSGVLLLVSFVLGCVLGLGTFLLVAPLVRQCESTERMAAAGAALCGTCLAFLWSPLLMGSALVSAMVPLTSPVSGPLLGLPLSLSGLLVALAAYDGLQRGVPAMAIAMLRPLLGTLAVLLGAVLLLGFGLGLSLATSVVLAIGGLVAARLLAGRRDAIPAVIAGSAGKLGGSLVDLPLYVAGLVLARAIADSGALESLAAGGVLPAEPHLLLPLLVPVGLILALLGLNAVVATGVVVALSAAAPGQSSPELLLLLALFTWTVASMLGFTSVTLAMAGSGFGVAPWRLLSRRNLGVALACGAVLSTLLILETVR